MREYPTYLSAELESLDILNDDETIAISAISLEEDGYEIKHGLTEYFAGSIAIAATLPDIKRHYPEDQSIGRFGSDRSVRQWMREPGGKAVYLMLQKQDDGGERLAGYGWVSPATHEEVRKGETEINLRVTETSKQNYLFVPFATLVIEASKKYYGAKNYWTEIWDSDTHAIEAYRSLGFRAVKGLLGKRKERHKREVLDARIYLHRK